MKTIRYSQPYLDSNDFISLKKSLKNNYLTQGPQQLIFEKKINSKFNFKYSAMVSNASNALIIALKTLDIKIDDVVWTSNITFCSNINSILHLGAKVVLVDVDKDYPNISYVILKKKLEQTDKKKLPKVVVITHMGGVCLNMKRIWKLSKKYKFRILEDASHALGSRYECGNYVGSCIYSEISVFSMHAIKIITTGEGGIITLKSKSNYNKVKKLISHSIVKKPNKSVNSPDYDVDDLGYNFRLTDFQCALGMSQLKKINFFHKKRVNVARIYINNLSKEKYSFYNKNINFNSWHLFIIRINKKFIHKKYQLIQSLNKNKIETRVHYIPNHFHTYYKKNNNVIFNLKDLKNSISYFEESLSIPIHPMLKNTDLRKIIKILNSAFYDL